MAQHTLEPTSVSLTDTLVNRARNEDGRPSLISAFSGVTIISPSSEQPLVDVNQPHPEQSESLECGQATIPPSDPGRKRTLVLCFDGTGDQFDADNSNIVQLLSLLKKDDNSQQMVYYQSGIGTYVPFPILGSLTTKIAMTFDLMFAWGMDSHIMSGYKFLVQTYKPGDKICLFGFSRGAQTARSLAGMIQKVGLLPANNSQQIPFAYKMYTRCDDTGWAQSGAFKKAFSVPVDSIEFIGVWDTVDAVGLVPKKLPFASSATIIRTFRHALALDEHRAMFKANPWNRPNADEQKRGKQQKPEPINSLQKVKTLHMFDPKREDTENGHERFLSEEKVEITGQREPSQAEKDRKEVKTNIKEVWFMGCHCDVGGGSVTNGERNSLARIPLRWMIRECFRTNTGIMFDKRGLREIGLDPDALYPYVIPRPPAKPVGDAAIKEIPPNPPSWIRRSFSRVKKKLLKDSGPANVATVDPPIGTEEEEDLKDALSPMYDQLKLKRGWWILEIFPLRQRYQRGDDTWASQFYRNMGRPRFIPRQHADPGMEQPAGAVAKQLEDPGEEEHISGVRIHRSVKTRMDACYPWKKPRYTPRPEIRVEPFWVD